MCRVSCPLIPYVHSFFGYLGTIASQTSRAGLGSCGPLKCIGREGLKGQGQDQEFHSVDKEAEVWEYLISDLEVLVLKRILSLKRNWDNKAKRPMGRGSA